MGIYTSGEVFGLRIYTFGDDDISKTLFEEQYDEIMSFSQMREVYLFYTQLHNKTNICFKFYSHHSSTYNSGEKKYMDWHQMSLDTFIEKFSI